MCVSFRNCHKSRNGRQSAKFEVAWSTNTRDVVFHSKIRTE